MDGGWGAKGGVTGCRAEGQAAEQGTKASGQGAQAAGQGVQATPLFWRVLQSFRSVLGAGLLVGFQV